MIVTLPVSHLISAENVSRVPGIRALEFKDVHHTFATSLPSLFHINLGIVQDAFMSWLRSSLPILRSLDMRLLSFDCGPANRRPTVEGYRYVSNGDVLSRDAALGLIRERVGVVRDCLEAPLGVENLNYFPTDAYAHVCEPDFIARVVSDNRVGVVLDLAHAIVTAENTKTDVVSYLRALPLERVCEVHLSAPGLRDGVWRDLHESPTDREYALLDVILPYVPRDVYVAIENFASLDAVVADYSVLVEFLRGREALDDVSCDAVALRRYQTARDNVPSVHGEYAIPPGAGVCEG